MQQLVKWTPEMDARLIDLIGQRKTTYQAAKELGLKRETVKKRSVKIGVRFGRWTKLTRDISTDGHKAADERSAELMRAAGIKI